MTIIELGALGEFVSSVAMLLTLVYLAVQVRQTKQIVQSSSHQTGIATMTQNNQNVYVNKELSNIVIKGLFDDDLDPTEWFRFGLWCMSLFHVFQQYFLDSEKGLGDSRIWAGEERAMKSLLAEPGVVRWWRESLTAIPYTDTFVDHVNTILGSVEETEG